MLGTRSQGFEFYNGSATQWIKTGGVLTVNSTETYQAACLAGLGIIQVPRVGVRDLRAGEKLIEIPAPVPRRAAARLADLSHRRNLPPGTSVYGVAGRTDESVCRLAARLENGRRGRHSSLTESRCKEERRVTPENNPQRPPQEPDWRSHQEDGNTPEALKTAVGRPARRWAPSPAWQKEFSSFPWLRI